MKIHIEKIKRLRAELDAINKLDLRDIEFYEEGKKLEISNKIIEDFRFTGLNTASFIFYDYYKGN